MNIKQLWLLSGLILGLAIGDFIWYLRLSQDRFLREMLFYLNDGDLSIFVVFGLMELFIFFIILLIVFAVEKMIKEKEAELK